jgi:hypothetical protein
LVQEKPAVMTMRGWGVEVGVGAVPVDVDVGVGTVPLGVGVGVGTPAVAVGVGVGCRPRADAELGATTTSRSIPIATMIMSAFFITYSLTGYLAGRASYPEP